MDMFNPIETLESQNLLLRELRGDDFEALYSACSDPKIWEQTPFSNRHEPDIFTQWFDEAIVQQALIIIDKHNKKIIGSSRYYETNHERKETVIGYTFLIREYWGGTTNKDIKKLMLEHAWKHFDTVWLQIAEDNLRSRKAAEKIGALLDHKGLKNGHPYCWYLLPKGII